MKMKKKIRNMGIIIGAISVFGILLFYFLQTYWVHRKFHETEEKIECVHLLGWFTMEDRLKGERHTLTEPQPGDILVTLSTHSLGWRHGHAALVIDEDTTLECVTWGTKSQLCDIQHWGTYSNCALLRIKGVTPEQQEQVVEYALEHLLAVDYHLSAGFLGEKAPVPEAPQFGLQCGYLVWYAWNHMGYDVDSDGGRLVTSHDLLHSDLLEVIEIYGMNEELEPIQ